MHPLIMRIFSLVLNRFSYALKQLWIRFLLCFFSSFLLFIVKTNAQNESKQLANFLFLCIEKQIYFSFFNRQALCSFSFFHFSFQCLILFIIRWFLLLFFFKFVQIFLSFVQSLFYEMEFFLFQIKPPPNRINERTEFNVILSINLNANLQFQWMMIYFRKERMEKSHRSRGIQMYILYNKLS